MRFRLTYDGPLLAKQSDPRSGQRDPKAPHIHGIRKEFHKQLRHHWETNDFLKNHTSYPADHGLVHPLPNGSAEQVETPSGKVPLREIVANLHEEHGYRFVPLVRKEWNMQCELDILFLRRDMPGSLVQAGDIDNRLKVLIDALRKPANPAELRENEAPAPGEDPFFVLLQDDNLVSALRVETDRLLRYDDGDKDQARVGLTITVTIRPFRATMFSLGFV